MTKIILVTGGLGFIAKHFISNRLDKGDYIICVDSKSYCADGVFLNNINSHPNFKFVHCKIQELSYLPLCDIVINFAAESSVDKSFTTPADFISTNIRGVENLLNLIITKRNEDRPKFIQISTDEVYGPSYKILREESKLNPCNPYAASKAAAEMLIHGYSKSYNITYDIIRMSNVYGPNQYPEKLIPKTCYRLSKGLPPVSHVSDNSVVRTWLHVLDAIDAINEIINFIHNNEIYNIAGKDTIPVKEVISKIKEFSGSNLDIELVENRLYQDAAYNISSEKLSLLIGWKPVRDFNTELRKIVENFDPKRFIQPWNGIKIKA